MGTLLERESGHLIVLEPQTVIGRDPRCSLQVSVPWVSTQHALVRWAAAGWELRDLSSRNGTFLDGERVKPGLTYSLHEGCKLTFGRRGEREWTLSDGSGPVPMATPVGGGGPVLLDGNLIALPTAECPAATIFFDGEGWVLEDAEGGRTALSSGDVFDVNGAAWRFAVPAEMMSATHLASSLFEFDVRHLHLLFRVSSDEEVVAVRMSAGGAEREVGTRSCNYLLLTLARRRLQDMKDGLPDGNCGWIDYDDLKHDPAMAPPHLNLDVFRLRQIFAKLGVADAARIIERRPRTRELRIGTRHISISPL